MDRYYGFYRARVTEVDLADYKDYGAIRVFIPDVMMDDIDSEVDPFSSGLIAYPANSPMGGRNEEDQSGTSFYQGSVYTPPVGAYVWVFFERGNLDTPFFFSSFNCECAKLPVENIKNPDGSDITNPSKVQTVLKTPEGRSIIVSDDENTQRIEITGKRRTLSGTDPSGNYESAYTIDDNMTTILLDERSEKQKLLIRTYKGDFIHVDIDDRKLQIDFEGDINIRTGGNLSLDVDGNIQVNSGGNQNYTAGDDINLKAGGTLNATSSSAMNLNSSGNVRIDGAVVYENSGVLETAVNASPTSPSGSRDT